MAYLSKVDKKGRVLIPKSIREKTNMIEGRTVKIYVEGSKIIIEPLPKVKKVKAKILEEAFFDAGEATFGD